MTEEKEIEKKEAPREIARDARMRQYLTHPGFLSLVEKALPKDQGMDAERLIWVVITLLETPDDKGNLNLLNCTPDSVRRAVVQCAEVGLEPSIGGECWIIPRGGKATFQMGALGYIKLAQRAGAVSAWANVVYESDDFQVTYGAHPGLHHDATKTWHLPGSNCDYDHKRVVSVADGGRGKPLGAYACVKMKDGEVIWSLVTEAELQMARGSGSGNSPAYRNWPDSMRMRTAIARAQKFWPKGQMSAALAMDENNMIRADLATGLKEIDGSGEEVQDKALEAKSGLDRIVALKKASEELDGNESPQEPDSGAPMSAQEQADIEASERTAEE